MGHDPIHQARQSFDETSASVGRTWASAAGQINGTEWPFNSNRGVSQIIRQVTTLSGLPDAVDGRHVPDTAVAVAAGSLGLDPADIVRYPRSRVRRSGSLLLKLPSAQYPFSNHRRGLSVEEVLRSDVPPQVKSSAASLHRSATSAVAESPLNCNFANCLAHSASKLSGHSQAPTTWTSRAASTASRATVSSSD